MNDMMSDACLLKWRVVGLRMGVSFDALRLMSQLLLMMVLYMDGAADDLERVNMLGVINDVDLGLSVDGCIDAQW